MQTKHALAFLIYCLFASAFAQESPPKLAVHVSGARDSSINKSLENKLLAAFAQSGRYVAAQAAGQNDADFVCRVSIAEAFGVYSILANMIETANSKSVKTGSVDSPLNSFEELAKASDSLARQFLQDAAPPPAAAAAAQKECERTYNINEIMFKVKDGFPTQLKDCASKLAKDMLTPASLGGKKLEPKSFMMQCPVDGIKKELPDGFPGADKLIGSLANFVQVILNSAMAGGGLDPKKLVSAVGSMDINGLLSDIKNLASGECMVNEPYEPPAKPEGGQEEGDGGEKDKGIFSLGFRAGTNFSHLYETYEYRYANGFNVKSSGSSDNAVGFQGGLAFDWALSGWFHIQPGIMYIRKGAEYRGYNMARGYSMALDYIELPFLISLKFSVLRLNAGPYYSIGIGGENDYGLSLGGGFDIGDFYIGVFYDRGLEDVGGKPNFTSCNRALGFNLGYNL